MIMARLGDEIIHEGVTYVLVDASLFIKLNPVDDLICVFCALDPRELTDVCLAADCDIDNTNADVVYVKKLEVKNE